MSDDRTTIERGIAAWNEGGVDAFAEYLAPDVVWHAPPEFPTGDVWRDRESLLPVIRDQFGPGGVFPGYSMELAEAREAPNGWFLETRQHATHTSGASLDWMTWFVVRLAHEQVQEIWAFMDRDPALRQAGLHG
jgi:ketosteroid isomerase-like protein